MCMYTIHMRVDTLYICQCMHTVRIYILFMFCCSFITSLGFVVVFFGCFLLYAYLWACTVLNIKTIENESEHCLSHATCYALLIKPNMIPNDFWVVCKTSGDSHVTTMAIVMKWYFGWLFHNTARELRSETLAAIPYPIRLPLSPEKFHWTHILLQESWGI